VTNGRGLNPLFSKEKCTVLVVLAHPDDEVMMCGTIAKLKAKHNQVHLLYLTHGEDGPTGGLVEKSVLGETRWKELDHVGQVLKVDSLTVLDYPDRYLNSVPKELIFEAIGIEITRYQPEYLFTFDSSLGLYGHEDHRYCGECAIELALTKQFNLRSVFVMTLSPSMIHLALKMSQTFKKRYNASKGLPLPTASVNISRFGKQKHEVILCHRTQWQVMGDVQPLYDKIPYFLYYRILRKEYFHEIEIGSRFFH
jgi:LmbE family N-acetylglucosaminyl deacetylase